MASLNHITLTGNLTRDAEMRATPSGSMVLFFDIAVNRRYKDKTGNFQEETLFIRVNYWGTNRQLEPLQPFLTKGREVFVDGYLKQRSWDTPEGQKRTVIEVQAFNCHPLEKVYRSSGNAGPDQGYNPPPPMEETSDDVPF